MVTATPLEGDEGWRVGDTSFVFAFGHESTVDRFSIRKPASLMRRYVEVAPRFRGAHIVELGIAAGGSTALLALLTEPRSLTAFELAPEPVAALDELILARGLHDVVRPCYGFDQADAPRLAAVADAHARGDPLDLVIDDASHRYMETAASFDVLFPRLRPGGWYVIEDWAADFAYAARIAETGASASAESTELRRRLEAAADAPRPTPLPRLGMELLDAAGAAPEIVSRLEVDRHWIVVERGPASIDPDGFQLRDHCPDHWGLLG